MCLVGEGEKGVGWGQVAGRLQQHGLSDPQLLIRIHSTSRALLKTTHEHIVRTLIITCVVHVCVVVMFRRRCWRVQRRRRRALSLSWNLMRPKSNAPAKQQQRCRSSGLRAPALPSAARSSQCGYSSSRKGKEMEVVGTRLQEGTRRRKKRRRSQWQRSQRLGDVL